MTVKRIKAIRSFGLIGLPLAWASASLLTAQSLTNEAVTVWSPFGVARNQHVRLTAVALPESNCSLCMVQMDFHDLSGNTVGPSLSVNLKAGQSASVDLPYSALVQSASPRREVVPMVSVTQAAGIPAAVLADVLASAQIIDDFTGFTLLAVFPVVPTAEGIPLHFGPIGEALGQIVRLNVVAYPPSPCTAQLGFVDLQGNTLGSAPRSVSLSPGQGTFVELPASSVVNQFGARVEVRPVITIVETPGVPSSFCAASAELYDTLTGLTWAYFPVGGW